jgi:glycosyltransferase involved in cell wall biosynthesis
MSKLKLIFFVNGSQSSASGIRSQRFAQKLPAQWDITIEYRTFSKSKSILHFISTALQFKPDIIYVVDTSYSGVLASYVAKKLLGSKVITDTGDVTYALGQSEGIYSSTELALIGWIEQIAMKKSDSIIVRGSHHKEWLKDQGCHNVTFVPDGVDTNIDQPVDGTSMRTELGLGNDLTVGLLGTMYWSKQHQMCYGWDIVEAMALLKNQPVKALLVGDGNGRAILEKRAQELDVSHKIVFTGYVPYEFLSQYLSAMDVCVSTQSNDLVGMVRTTGKLPLYLAYGKYVIATDVGEAQKVLPSIGCLLPYNGVRDDTHPARLAQHLSFLLENLHLLKIEEKARQIAKENFDYDLLAERVKNLCLNLVGQSDINNQ